MRPGKVRLAAGSQRDMTYAEAIKFLYSLQMFGARPGLENPRRLAELAGNPHHRLRFIHVAGTNGKGSVAHMLSAIFSASGLKTGLYTSPHYKDFRERVKIDGVPIPEKGVVEFVGRHKAFCETLKPSFFEWTVGLAFDYFAREQVDIAIIEVGMGGRLDSTNVITPLVSVITNISFDHQQFLGETLPEIAGEKAGIIKPGVPVVIGETQPETALVFEKKARDTQAPIFFADQNFKAELLGKSAAHAAFRVSKNEQVIFEKLALNHLADYQQKNLLTVLQTLDVLGEKFPWSGEHIEEGLGSFKRLAGFQGRWQIIRERPTILCDSAHNEGGLRLAIEGLKGLKYNRLHFVYGTVSDKDLGKIFPLLSKEARYYFAKANIPRGMDAQILKREAIRHGMEGKAYRSVKLALAAALKSASPEDLIFVSGSIFVVAEVLP